MSRLSPQCVACLREHKDTCTSGWFQINITSAQEDERENSRGRRGGAFQFSKKIKAGPWRVLVPVNLHIQPDDYISSACVPGDSDIWGRIVLRLTPHKGFVRRNFSRVDESMWLLCWRKSKWGAGPPFFGAISYPVALTQSE